MEVSPESLVLTKSLAKKLAKNGGLCLIADYGHKGDGTDTFRAFKRHKLHDPLIEPGTADLTADVDFAAIKDVFSQQQQQQKNDVTGFNLRNFRQCNRKVVL